MLDDVDVHAAFIRAVLTQTREDVFVQTDDLSARLEVYRRNFMQGYCNALKHTYTMTAQYLGDVQFTDMAIAYVCAHRPLAGQLFATYGQSFPDMLEDPLANDLAQLEWVLQSVAMTEEDGAHQEDVSSEDRWQLRTDVRLFQSKYRIGEVYAALRSNESGIKVVEEASQYAVVSHEGVPTLIPLTEHEHAALRLLQSPRTFDEIFDKLTFPKEILTSIVSRIYNRALLKKV